jgi:hypothetical protein
MTACTRSLLRFSQVDRFGWAHMYNVTRQMPFFAHIGGRLA